MATTLRELRVRVADLLGEVVVALASTAIPAPASTVRSDIEFQDDKNHFRGADLLIVDGPSANHRARVVASSLENMTLTFAPASANGIDAGNEVQVFGVRSNMRIQRIDRAIRAVQKDAFPAYKVPHSETLADLYYPSIEPEITLPASFTHVHSVTWEGWDGTHHAIRPGKPNTAGWSLLPGRKMIISGNSRSYADGRYLTVYGYRQEADLVLDTDSTGIDQEWMVATAALYLRMGQDGQESMAKAGMIGGRADALRVINTTPVHANTRKVIP
jgi:hypothetical protein